MHRFVFVLCLLALVACGSSADHETTPPVGGSGGASGSIGGGAPSGGAAGDGGTAGENGGAAGESGTSGIGGVAGGGASGASGQGGAIAGGGAGGAGGSAGTAGSGGAAGSDGGAGGATAIIELAPTDGSVSMPFRLATSAKGSSFVGPIMLTDDWGTIELNGRTLPALAYFHQSWASQGYELYQVLAVGEDRWYALWLYCGETSNALEWVYYEGTDGTKMAAEQATGTCTITPGAATPHVQFPAVAMPIPKLVKGFTVKGSQIDIESGVPGWLYAGGEKVTALPFDYVDCSTNCGSPGWWELHMVLWNEPKQSAEFGIVYLFAGQNLAELEYTLSLPDLGMPGENMMYGATWTAMPLGFPRLLLGPPRALEAPPLISAGGAPRRSRRRAPPRSPDERGARAASPPRATQAGRCG